MNRISGLGPILVALILTSTVYSPGSDFAVLSITSPPDTVLLDSTFTPAALIQAAVPNLAESTLVRMTIGSTYDDTVVAVIPAGDTLEVTFQAWQAQQTGNFTACCSLLTPDCDTTNNVGTKQVRVREPGGPPSGEWVHSFLSWDTTGSCVQVTSDNGYVAAGEVNVYPGQLRATETDAFLWRVDSGGNTLWRRSYAWPGIDGAGCVAQAPDGGFIVAGGGHDAADTLRAGIMKVDSLGNPQWQYSGPANSSASDIVQTTDGGFAYTWASHWLADAGTYLAKVDGQGQPLWSRLVAAPCGLSWPCCAVPLQQTDDAGFITGTQQLVKTDSTGTVQWSRTYADLPEIHSVRQTADGGFIATGCGPDPSDSRREAVMVLLKTNSSGSKTWVKRFVWDFESWGLCVRQTSDGGYMLAGQSYGTILVRTDQQGNVVWTLRPTQKGVAKWVEQTPDGGYVFVSANHLVKLPPDAR